MRLLKALLVGLLAVNVACANSDLELQNWFENIDQSQLNEYQRSIYNRLESMDNYVKEWKEILSLMVFDEKHDENNQEWSVINDKWNKGYNYENEVENQVDVDKLANNINHVNVDLLQQNENNQENQAIVQVDLGENVEEKNEVNASPKNNKSILNIEIGADVNAGANVNNNANANNANANNNVNANAGNDALLKIELGQGVNANANINNKENNNAKQSAAIQADVNIGANANAKANAESAKKVEEKNSKQSKKSRKSQKSKQDKQDRQNNNGFLGLDLGLDLGANNEIDANANVDANADADLESNNNVNSNNLLFARLGLSKRQVVQDEVEEEEFANGYFEVQSELEKEVIRQINGEEANYDVDPSLVAQAKLIVQMGKNADEQDQDEN